MRTQTADTPVAYRYTPPAQRIAQAETCIGDVVLTFSLTVTGWLTLHCSPGDDGGPGAAADGAGAALHRLADGLFVSALRGDHLRIESGAGHRFVHRASSAAGPRVRRFTGECQVTLPCAQATGIATLGYTLEVTADAQSDPPGGPADWTARYDDSLASIGAVVLEPLPITAAHAARLVAA